MDRQYLLNYDDHDSIIEAEFTSRGYSKQESNSVAKISRKASEHGISSHNGLKAVHLDNLFGSKVGGCMPNADYSIPNADNKALESWYGNGKIGTYLAYKAVDRCIELADKFGIGMISVQNAWHYLWGGGYVLEMANKGFIGISLCTAMLAEVVPYRGKFPTLGTNPHSYCFPTKDAIGYNILIDWATSVIAMGKLQSLKREGMKIPHGAASDKNGNITTDPDLAEYLLPFGNHKGYGLSLVNELLACFNAGCIPTLRGREFDKSGNKLTNLFFIALNPEFLNVSNNKQSTLNLRIKATLEDIIGHGNDDAIFPGYLEYLAQKKSKEKKGLLLTYAEKTEFEKLAKNTDQHATIKKLDE